MRRAALLVLGALVGSALGPVPSAAAAEEVYERPASGSFAVEGRGYGHGRGMSQWGTQGAALQGRTADEITAFYYPGTAKGSLPNSPIRVWISADEGRDTTVRPASGLRVTDAATGRSSALPGGPSRWRVVPSGTGLQLQQLSGSTWSASSALPGTLTGPVRFDGPTFTRVDLPGGTARDYRGAVTAVRSGSGLKTVVVLGLEDYLLGVVPRESPSSWEPAALQAQSIAARSYSAYKRERVKAGADYDICETTACQVFGGSRSISAGGSVTELEPASTTAAVRATAGVVRTWQGRAVFAEFSSSSGGFTSRGDVPYLAAQEDPYDGVAKNTVSSWRGALTVAQLERAFPSIGTFRRLRVTDRDGNGTWGGRVTRVVLEGDRGTATTTGAGIRAVAPWPSPSNGIKSSWWKITTSTAPSEAPPSVGTAPPSARVTQKSLTPTLQAHPGPGTGSVGVAVENTGRTAWPTSGLHLALAGGAADSLAGGSTRPGAFTGNRTRPGAPTVEPGETATFRVDLDARRLAAGSHPRSYWLRVDSGPLFGAEVAWPFRVVQPRLTAAPAGVSGTLPDGRTVVVPKDGTATVRLSFRNTGDLTWPAGAAALGTSVPRNRSSAFAGEGWSSPTRAGRSTAEVAPGAVGTIDLVLNGRGGAVGTWTERVEPLWSGAGWLEGAATGLTVVRTDPSLERSAVLHSAPREVRVPLRGTATAVVRMRNVGAGAWTIGAEELSSGSLHPLRTRTWRHGVRTPALAVNLNRPGARTVEPGELGEWRVPLSGVRAGTFATTLRAVGPGGVYGPAVPFTAVVR